MSNSTIIEYVTDMFVSVPGTMVGGWVGFGLFCVLFGVTVILGAAKKIPSGNTVSEMLIYCLIMLVSYLLVATEQFIIERDNKDHVNLLMVVLNGGAWTVAVLNSARRLPDAPREPYQKLAFTTGILSQVLLLLSAFVWNGVVYALWALSLVLMASALAFYCYAIVEVSAIAVRQSKVWVIFALGYTVLYALFAFLSHLYLAVLSLAGAVWAFLVLHVAAYCWLVYLGMVSKRQTMVVFPGSPIPVDDSNP